MNDFLYIRLTALFSFSLPGFAQMPTASRLFMEAANLC